MSELQAEIAEFERDIAAIEAELADEHDTELDAPCTCETCERVRDRDRARRCELEALTYGGLAPIAHELLGPDWLDGEKESQGVASINQLAQRSLGDVFAQLEKVGALGRELCNGQVYAAPEEVPPVRRPEIKALLDWIESVLPYATSQLAYLSGPRYRHNDRVIVHVGEEQKPISARVVGMTVEGKYHARLDGPEPYTGLSVECREDELIGAAQ